MQGSEADHIRDLQSCIESLTQAADGRITVADCLTMLLNIICRRVGTKVVAGSLSFLADQGEGVYLTWLQAKTRNRLRGGDVERGLVTLTRTTNRTQLVGNIHAYVPPGYIRWMKQGQEEISSELAVPIRSLGRAVGVIDVASTRAEAFSQKDRLWLEHVACLVEAVLVRHFMTDELAHGKDLSSIQDGVLHLAVEASGLNEVDASLLICDKNRQVVVQTLSMRRRTASDSPGPGTNEWSISRGITGQAIRERQEQVSGDLPSGDDIFTPSMPSQLAVCDSATSFLRSLVSCERTTP